jgi:hypothetical protein
MKLPFVISYVFIYLDRRAVETAPLLNSSASGDLTSVLDTQRNIDKFHRFHWFYGNINPQFVAIDTCWCIVA